MSLNAKKSQAMLIGNGKLLSKIDMSTISSISIGSSPLETVDDKYSVTERAWSVWLCGQNEQKFTFSLRRQSATFSEVSNQESQSISIFPSSFADKASKYYPPKRRS